MHILIINFNLHELGHDPYEDILEDASKVTCVK